MTLAKLIATVLGVGYIRPASGTWGSLVALPWAWLTGLLLSERGFVRSPSEQEIDENHRIAAENKNLNKIRRDSVDMNIAHASENKERNRVQAR